MSRERVRRLMRTMGLQAIHRRPRTSSRDQGTRCIRICWAAWRSPGQTPSAEGWAADITYIPMAGGFHYLVAIMDLHTRYVVAWRLSNTLDADLCVEALEEALGKGRPEVFNTDQGSQFTGEGFTGLLEQHGVRISMDGVVGLQFCQ